MGLEEADDPRQGRRQHRRARLTPRSRRWLALGGALAIVGVVVLIAWVADRTDLGILFAPAVLGWFAVPFFVAYVSGHTIGRALALGVAAVLIFAASTNAYPSSAAGEAVVALVSVGLGLTLVLRAATWAHVGARVAAVAVAAFALLAWRNSLPDHDALLGVGLLAFPLVGAADEVLERVDPSKSVYDESREPLGRLTAKGTPVWGLALGIVACATVALWSLTGFDFGFFGVLFALAMSLAGTVTSIVALVRGDRRGLAAVGLAVSLLPIVAAAALILFLIWVFNEGGFA